MPCTGNRASRIAVPGADSGTVAPCAGTWTSECRVGDRANGSCADTCREDDVWFTYEDERIHLLRWTTGNSDQDGSDPGQTERGSCQVVCASGQAAGHSDEHRRNAQPILLLHGFMQSADSWRTVVQILAQTRTVYALDFMGHGRSSTALHPERYAFDDMACCTACAIRMIASELTSAVATTPESTASRFLSGINVQQSEKVHVAGYSMGARIALKVATLVPDALASLTLESCNLGCATQQERQSAARRNNEWIRRLQQDGLESFVEYWESLPLFATQRQLGLNVQLRPGRLNNNRDALIYTLQGSGKQAMPLVDETLQGLKRVVGRVLPAQYLWGTKDAKCASVAQALSLIGFETHTFDTGHNVHLEVPMLYLKELTAFLDRSEC